MSSSLDETGRPRKIRRLSGGAVSATETEQSIEDVSSVVSDTSDGPARVGSRSASTRSTSPTVDEPRIFKLLDHSLWRYRAESDDDGVIFPDRVGKRESLDQLLLWGPKHCVCLRGRATEHAKYSHFLLETVHLKRDAKGDPVLLGVAYSDNTRHFVQLEQHHLQGQDRGWETIQQLLDAADACEHASPEACEQECLDQLVKRLDELYASKQWRVAASSETRRSCLLSMLHLVEGLGLQSMVLALLGKSTKYGKHAASLLIYRLALEAGLFAHSTSCNASDTPVPPSEPEMPLCEADSSFAGRGSINSPHCTSHEVLRVVSKGNGEVQRVRVGDFVTVDAPKEGDWVARIISTGIKVLKEGKQAEPCVHLQWCCRQDALPLYNGGQFLCNELFMLPHCSDEPISSIRGKIDVRVLEGRAALQAVDRNDGCWILRYQYDATSNGRLSFLKDTQALQKQCSSCLEQAQHQEENADVAGGLRPVTGTGSVLFRFAGVDYHENDVVSYGLRGSSELIQLLKFHDDPLSPTVRVRLLLRNDLRHALSDKQCVAPSGATITHIHRERKLRCVPGRLSLPLVSYSGDAEHPLLGKQKFIVAQEFTGGPGVSDLPLLVDTSREAVDFILTDYCGPIAEATCRKLLKHKELSEAEKKVISRALDESTPAELIKACEICFKQRNAVMHQQEKFIKLIRRAALAPPFADLLITCSSAKDGNRKLQVLDVFAGLGGTALGIVSAMGALPFVGRQYTDWLAEQGRVRSACVSLIAVDLDEEATKAYQENLPFARTHPTDIDELVRGLISDFNGTRGRLLRPAELDLMILTPPCQAFSGLNMRASLVDHRAALIASSLSLVELLKPRVVLIEEVPGLLQSRFREVYRFIIRALTALGYSTDVGLRCTSQFGLAQARERCLILATRLDCANQCLLPQPTHERAERASSKETPEIKIPLIGKRDLVNGDAAEVRLKHIEDVAALRPPVKLQSFDDLPPFDWHHVEAVNDNGDAVPAASAFSRAADFDDIKEYAAHAVRADEMYASKVMGWTSVDYRRPPANALQRYYRRCHLSGNLVNEVTDHVTPPVTAHVVKTAYALEIDEHTGSDRAHGPYNAHRMKREVLRTVTTKQKRGKELVGGTQRRTLHTMRELLRLQGFPDSYRFPDGMTISTRERLVGNAVSPVLAYHIGRSIMQTLMADLERDANGMQVDD